MIKSEKMPRTKIRKTELENGQVYYEALYFKAPDLLGIFILMTIAPIMLVLIIVDPIFKIDLFWGRLCLNLEKVKSPFDHFLDDDVEPRYEGGLDECKKAAKAFLDREAKQKAKTKEQKKIERERRKGKRARKISYIKFP